MRYHLEHAKHRLVEMLHLWQGKLTPLGWAPLKLPTIQYTEPSVRRLSDDSDAEGPTEMDLDGETNDNGDVGEDNKAATEVVEEEFEDLGVECGDRYGPEGLEFTGQSDLEDEQDYDDE